MTVFKIEPSTPNAYFMPGADPGEGYMSTNNQLFGSGPANSTVVPGNDGFVKDFAYTLSWESTQGAFTDISGAASSHFGVFADFRTAAAGGTLAAFTFLEPSWGSTGNSQHPNYDVALGEQFIHEVYEALRTGPAWAQTLLVVTYDEHGGCYDHVPPPWGATVPDKDAGEFGFDFTRFGVRVPAVLVSPLIAPGTVFRVPAGSVRWVTRRS